MLLVISVPLLKIADIVRASSFPPVEGSSGQLITRCNSLHTCVVLCCMKGPKLIDYHWKQFCSYDPLMGGGDVGLVLMVNWPLVSVAAAFYVMPIIVSTL